MCLSFLCILYTHTGRERKRDRERERKRDRQTGRQTDRQTNRDRETMGEIV